MACPFMLKDKESTDAEETFLDKSPLSEYRPPEATPLSAIKPGITSCKS